MELPKEKLKSPTDTLLLIALANYANHEGGSIFPSNQTLQKNTKLDRATIKRSLRRLEKAKLIERISQKIVAVHIERKDKRPHAYRLLMDP